MINQSDYEYVLNHPNKKLRQEFIDEVDLGEARNFVSQVKYIPERDINDITSSKEIFTREKLMRVTPHPLTYFWVKGKKARINVYSPAFSQQDSPKLEDFLVTLIHHEGYHAKEMFEEPKKIIANQIKVNFDRNAYIFAFTMSLKRKFYERLEEFKKFACKCELRAYKNELEKALILECSEKHIKNVGNQIRLLEISLH